MSRRSLFARTRNLTSLFLNNHSFLRHYRHSAPPLHSTATTSITNHFQNPCLPIGTTMAQLQQQKLLHHHHHLNLDLDLAPNSPPPPIETTKFNFVQTYIKTFKLLNGQKFSPDRYSVFTIHNFIGKPPIKRKQEVEFKPKELPTDLYHELKKNWQYLGAKSKMDSEKLKKNRQYLGAKSKMDSEKFFGKRFNRYANKQTRFETQEEYFRSALKLRRVFDLDSVIPKIASATSIERCSKFGVDWEIVDTRQFENELRQELGSSFRLSVKKHEGISYLHEVEISVDAELNKIPPNEKNCTTFGIAETFLV